MLLRLLSLLFLIQTGLLSQTLKSIEFRGAQDYSITDYQRWTGIFPGSPIFASITDTVRIRIERRLQEGGYFFSRVTAGLSSDSTLLIADITEGSQAEIRDCIIKNDSVMLPGIHDEFEYLEGRLFQPTVIEESISNALRIYEENGFPFATIRLASVYPVYDSVEEASFTDLAITILPGVRAIIDSIETVGNSKTDYDVILRELRIRRGDLYRQSSIDEIPKQLNRLRFFDPVAMPVFYKTRSGKGILKITLTERETNNFDGIIGYQPGQKENESGYVTGLVTISLRNLFGTGRGLSFRWQQPMRNTQELELKYLEPRILGLPVNVQGGVMQKKQDTLFVQRVFDGGIDYLASSDFTFSLMFSYESIIPPLNDNPVFTVYNSSKTTTGIGVAYDTRNDVYAPTSGLRFYNAYHFSQKKINGPPEFITPTTVTGITLRKIQIDAAWYLELFRQNVLALSGHYREVSGDFLELSDLIKLGGTNTLRGYREEQFAGSRVFWSNLEYRYLLTRRTYAFLFFDAGYYLRLADQENKLPEVSEWKPGYGLGMYLETGLGILGISFALGSGDSFSDGKIHFGFINEF